MMSNDLRNKTFEGKMNETTNEVKNKAEDYYQQGKDKVGKAKEEMESGFQATKETASQLWDEGKKKACEAQDYLENYSEDLVKSVRERPLTSLLVAGGVGYLLSVLFRK